MNDSYHLGDSMVRVVLQSGGLSGKCCSQGDSVVSVAVRGTQCKCCSQGDSVVSVEVRGTQW